MGGTGGFFAVVACAAAFIGVPCAHAASVSEYELRGHRIHYLADRGETNHVTLIPWEGDGLRAGGFRINDPDVIIRPGGLLEDCLPVFSDVYCSGTGGIDVQPTLGDGDDTFTTTMDIWTSVVPGPGNDTVSTGGGSDWIRADDGEADEIACGDGFDSVVADPIDSVDASCEHIGSPEP